MLFKELLVFFFSKTYKKQTLEVKFSNFLNISFPDYEHYEKKYDLNQFMAFIQLCNPILHLRLCHNFQTLSKILTTDLKSQVL